MCDSRVEKTVNSRFADLCIFGERGFCLFLERDPKEDQCMRSELPINIQPTGTTPHIKFEPLSLSVSTANQQKILLVEQ
jgi:hypothetical protein